MLRHHYSQQASPERRSAKVSLSMPRACSYRALFAVIAISALAGYNSTNSSATVEGSQAKRTASPSVAPADVVRELFAAEKAHNFTAFCAMFPPAARVELRRSDRDPLHEIGGSCEQHLMNEFAQARLSSQSNPIVGFGYTSLRTTSQNSETAVVEVKDETEGVSGTERSYTMELVRCGSAWLWNLSDSAMRSNPLAEKLLALAVKRYGCEPEAEAIKRRGLVIVNEGGPNESSGVGTSGTEG